MSMDGTSLPARIAREVTAVVIAGLVAGICFLIVIQEAHRRGHTDLDFNHTLGTIVLGHQAEDLTTRSALGVVGDSAAPTGLISALLLSIVVLGVFALLVVPFVHRGWIVRGLVLALITLLGAGLVYPPLASDYLDESIGAFGAGYGAGTVIALALASLVFGIVGSRCHSLIVSAGWWTPRGEVLEEALEEIDMGGRAVASLELPEQRGEDGGVRA